jgi:hypothetical protein
MRPWKVGCGEPTTSNKRDLAIETEHATEVLEIRHNGDTRNEFQLQQREKINTVMLDEASGRKVNTLGMGLSSRVACGLEIDILGQAPSRGSSANSAGSPLAVATHATKSRNSASYISDMGKSRPIPGGCCQPSYRVDYPPSVAQRIPLLHDDAV